MARIVIHPAGYTIEARHDETIMAAARRLGYYWPTTCGGQAICTTCACIVEQGADNLAPMGRAEHAALLEGRGRAALTQPLRLACQARVRGDITVRKPGVQPPSTT